MATDPEFLNHVQDLFADLGPVRTARMFGGTGLYVDDAMFAMIFDDAIYMKADKPLAAEYQDAGSEQFQYITKAGTRNIPGLMSLPDSAMDDPSEALFWARKSMVPALSSAVKRAKAKAKSK